jgi:hypothetical protein
METPREYHYTYYSYEEWGRGYFGSRTCECLPEKDVKYLGSSKDKTFKPKYKIILKDDYATREEAYADEIILQEYYKVVENPHFANKAYQTSTKFYYTVPHEEAVRNGNKSKELGLGIHSLSYEQRSIIGKIGGSIGGKVSGKKHKEKGTGIFSLTPEQKSKHGKNVYQKGLALLTTEQNKKKSKKAINTQKELGVGFFKHTKEERKQNSSKGGKSASRITNSQRWMCTETGFITNPGALTRYQRKRGIDTSKRIKIE